MPKEITIHIQKLRVGYNLFVSPQDNMVITAQEMLDIMDWCLLHARELEQEAKIHDRSDEDLHKMPTDQTPI